MCWFCVAFALFLFVLLLECFGVVILCVCVCVCFILYVFVCLFWSVCVCVCVFLSFLMKITVFPAILVFFGWILVESLFLIAVLVLAFCFVLFVICFKMFLCFSSACCLVFVLNHKIRFYYCSHLVFLLLFCLFYLENCISWFLATYQKHLSKSWNFRKPPNMKNAGKTDILTRAISTSVLTNSVFCFFLSWRLQNLLFFFWKHYKHSGFSQNKRKQHLKKEVKNGPRLC